MDKAIEMKWMGKTTDITLIGPNIKQHYWPNHSKMFWNSHQVCWILWSRLEGRFEPQKIHLLILFTLEFRILSQPPCSKLTPFSQRKQNTTHVVENVGNEYRKFSCHCIVLWADQVYRDPVSIHIRLSYQKVKLWFIITCASFIFM